MARCRRNVDNFLDACRRIGVDEVRTEFVFIIYKFVVVKFLVVTGHVVFSENSLNALSNYSIICTLVSCFSIPLLLQKMLYIRFLPNSLNLPKTKFHLVLSAISMLYKINLLSINYFRIKKTKQKYK